MTNKTIDAKKFGKQPGGVYRAADLGKDVTIRHSHYPDRVFKLMAIDKSAWEQGRGGDSSTLMASQIAKLLDADLKSSDKDSFTFADIREAQRKVFEVPSE